jgi:hypothetical protein
MAAVSLLAVDGFKKEEAIADWHHEAEPSARFTTAM